MTNLIGFPSPAQKPRKRAQNTKLNENTIRTKFGSGVLTDKCITKTLSHKVIMISNSQIYSIISATYSKLLG